MTSSPILLWGMPESMPILMACVLLHHTGGPMGDHYDWLIDAGDPAGLWGVRVSQDIARQRLAMFEATQTPPHRRDYLTVEGPVRGGTLGAVCRVGSGTVQVLSGSLVGPSVVVGVEWEGRQPLVLRGAGAAGLWKFVREEPRESRT